MRLTVWDPFREINSLFRDFPTRSRPSYPPIEVVEKDDNLVIKAELPGINKEEVELTVLGDTLTISGEKKLTAVEDVNYIRHERPHGTFRRLIDLPYAVNAENVSATYKDGILTVTLPRAEESKPRQISVE